MSNSILLTNEEILHLATLANLFLSPQEVQQFQAQFTETIKYVENLDELDISNVEATSQSVPLENVFFEDGTPNDKGFTQQEALSNSKHVKGEYFVVNRIM